MKRNGLPTLVSRRPLLSAIALGIAAMIAAASCKREAARVGAVGTADGLSAIASERGATLDLRNCQSVNRSRVIVCETTLSPEELSSLTSALELKPFDGKEGPGPAHGSSRCFEGVVSEPALRLITTFPWIPKSHFRYLLIVVPAGGGKACVETEHGYG